MFVEIACHAVLLCVIILTSTNNTRKQAMQNYLNIIIGCMLNGSKAGFTTIVVDSNTKAYTWFKFKRGELIDCKHREVRYAYEMVQAHLIQTGF